MTIYDTIILGAGPAGLTAAIYACRRGMKVLVLTKDIGGQIAKSSDVENYPGFINISGAELAQKMAEQAQKFGAEIIFEAAEKVEKSKRGFSVQTSAKKYEGKTLILAYGKTPRSLDAKGEKEFAGKGVSYCATCDMPIFKNKIVAVVGGGNSALDAAQYGAKLAKKVYLIHRRNELRADAVEVEKAKKTGVEFILNSVIKEIRGDKFVKSIIIEDVNTKKTKEVFVDGVFVEIGYEVKTDFISHLVKLDEFKQVIIDNTCATSTPGIFAAGDITNTPVKQAVVAAGEGAKAALSAYNYLHAGEPVKADWAK